MSIAGVRLTDGRFVWADAGEFMLHALDGVAVKLDGEEFPGLVSVAPDALLRAIETSGEIVDLIEHELQAADCGAIPGACMPPLGASFGGGTVMAVDAVNRTVTVALPDGTRVVQDGPTCP